MGGRQESNKGTPFPQQKSPWIAVSLPSHSFFVSQKKGWSIGCSQSHQVANSLLAKMIALGGTLHSTARVWSPHGSWFSSVSAAPTHNQAFLSSHLHMHAVAHTHTYTCTCMHTVHTCTFTHTHSQSTYTCVSTHTNYLNVKKNLNKGLNMKVKRKVLRIKNHIHF